MIASALCSIKIVTELDQVVRLVGDSSQGTFSKVVSYAGEVLGISVNAIYVCQLTCLLQTSARNDNGKMKCGGPSS